MYLIKIAGLSDVDLILNLQEKIWSGLEDKKTLQTSSREFIEYCINGGGIVYLIIESNNIIGYRFVYFPINRDFNLGRGILLSEQLDKVAHLDTTCLLKEWRGKGIGKHLANLAMDYIKENKMEHVFATVAPNNIASMNVMFHTGLHIIDYTREFQHKERFIFYRSCLRNDPTRETALKEKLINISLVNEINLYLKEKWFGVDLVDEGGEILMVLCK